MRNPGGYSILVDPDVSRPVEHDTVTCCHCQRVVFVKPGTASTVYLTQDLQGRFTGEEPGAFCRLCMAPVCLWCHAQGVCIPFARSLEDMER